MVIRKFVPLHPNYIIFIVGWQLAIITTLFSQSIYPQFDQISTEQGLSNNRINNSIKDHKGFIWIATADGLNRYDGNKFKIYKYDPDDSTSLSDNFVYSIREDRLGNIWVGTRSAGLNKFDRKTGSFTRIKLYPPNTSPEEQQQLNSIYGIYEDPYEKNNVLWIFTEKRSKTKIFNDGENTYYIGIQGGNNCIIVDSTTLWMGGPTGLRKLNKETGIVIPYYKNNIQGGVDISITDMYQDSDGLIWLACWHNGLMSFDPKTETYTGYKYNPDYPPGIGSNVVFDIKEDCSGKLWIVTAGDGYYQYDKNTEIFTCYKKPETYTRLGLNFWGKLFIDDADIHWITTKNDGILKYAPQKEKFNHYNLSSETEKEVDIRAFYKDKTDSLWVSSVDALYKFDTQTGRYSKRKYDPNHVNKLLQHSISVFKEDKNNILWLGTEGGGLKRYHIESERVSDYYKYTGTDIAEPVFEAENYILSMTEDLTGNFWIKSFGGFSHYLFDIKNLCYLNNPDSSFVNLCFRLETERLFIDHMGNYFCGTSRGGLYQLDSKYAIVKNYQQQQNNKSSISNNFIYTMFEDKSNNLWIGTAGGLNLFDREKQIFTSFFIKDGLASDIILSIEEDDHGNLWMSTPAGISKFTLDKSGQPQIKNYAISNPITFYAEKVSYKDDDGVMYFGGKNGFISFHPDRIEENTRIPPIVITDFKLFNESVQPDTIGKSPLQSDISEAEEIILSYDQNFFSFEFAALDYTDPQKNLYAYKMEGIDEDWVNSDASQRFANYTNIQPGEYVFRVKGSNNDGNWNEEGTSIQITITPPWWRTNWAFAVYVILFITTLYALRTYDKKRQHLKHELEMEHLHAEKLEEVDRVKSRFFTNISHEFRTPLTLIKGPMKQLVSGEFKGNLKKQYRMILRNSDRLLRLVNQLLDFSKLESGQMKLKVVHTDVIKFLKSLALSFCSLAEQKKISLNFETQEEALMGYIDLDKIEKIISNLLSNALKFTPQDGKIVLRVGTGEASPGKNQFSIGVGRGEAFPDKSQISIGVGKGEAFPGKIMNNPETFAQNASPQRSNIIEISVSNTGPGIPQDKLDKIFDRFYQADTTYKKDSEGTGIGLALTKELVELHHGIIEVQCTNSKKQPPKSPPPVGGSTTFAKGDLSLTTFTILLPLSKEHLSKDEIVEDISIKTTDDSLIRSESIVEHRESNIEYPASSIQHPVSSIPNLVSRIPHPESRIPSPASGLRSPLLLVVEDNPDVTTYIRSFMDDDFRVITALNGQEGWKKALESDLELIISDVMMPVMDGFELCKKLKSDQRTSHIPVILLTAKADLDSKIEGLEFGADDYISKPFEARELQVRVKNLIDQRKTLREKFRQMVEIKPEEVAVSSMDEKFLKHLLKVFENHISEADFSTEEFAREVGMSRMHLNRKLQALTSQSTHEFIRSLRLKRAAQLLKKTAGSVSEIAYSIGFNSPSHFAHAFRKQ